LGMLGNGKKIEKDYAADQEHLGMNK
jgi:hypothetical protein